MLNTDYDLRPGRCEQCHWALSVSGIKSKAEWSGTSINLLNLLMFYCIAFRLSDSWLHVKLLCTNYVVKIQIW